MKAGNVTIESRTVYEVHVWNDDHSFYKAYTSYDKFDAEEIASQWKLFMKEVAGGSKDGKA